MSSFLGGLANAYGGFQQGQEQELARQQLAKDRAYQQSQREYQGGQQQRTVREQGLADQLRTANMAVSDERDEPAPGLGVQLGAGKTGPVVDPAPVAPPGVGAADTPAGLAASLPPAPGLSSGSNLPNGTATPAPGLASQTPPVPRKVKRTEAEMATEYARNLHKFGQPIEAMEMASKAQSFRLADDNNKRAQVKFTREEAEYGKKMDEEGTFNGARAMDRGDVAGAMAALNAGGKYKVKDMVLTPKKSETPSGGTELSYDATYKIIHPDGRVTEETRNSRELLKKLMPFEKAWELEIKATEATGKVHKTTLAHEVAAETRRHNLVTEGAAAAKAAGGGSGKPLPISAAKGLLDNQTNLRRAQTALALVSGKTVDGATGDSDATGLKGLMPNQVLNRVDPQGVKTRAAIADLGSLVIHDRSGAAVTASEFPRLAPFIPTATDDAATVKNKLEMFTTNYQAIVDDAAEFYRASGYNVPTEVLRDGKGDQGAPAGAAQTKSVNIGGAAMEARQAPDGKYYVTLANGKFAEVKN